MWKKDEMTPSTPTAPRQEERPPRPEPPRPATGSSERATIGRSITIRGEVSGDEDLLIQGRIDGSVDLQAQSVTVGREGRVKADITGRVVTVEGEVEGDLKAQEQVILRGSARVEGDITAPRVVLEDGASFRGLVDMRDPTESEQRSSTGSASAQSKKAEPTKGSQSEAPKKDEGAKPAGDSAKTTPESKPSGESTKPASGTTKDASATAEKTLL